MKRLAMVALGALALSGCTGTHIKKPAVCDGKHRRPANLYGSILPTLPVPLPASQSGGQSMVAPGPGPGPAMLPPPPSAPMPMPPAAGPVAPATVPVPNPNASPMHAPMAPTPAPSGVDNSTSATPKTGAAISAPKTPQTSRREIALSYYSC